MKAVVFDFDGTLADSLLGVLAVYERAHKRDVPLTTKAVEGFRHKSVLQIGRELGIPLYKFVWLAVFGRKAFRAHIDKVRVYGGIEPMLRQLHAAGLQLYILSLNNPENIHDFLRLHDLEQYISAVYGKAFVLNKAPRLRVLMNQQGLERDDICFVGDQTIDVDSARRAGVRSVAVSWGYAAREKLARHQPTALVDTTEELQKVLVSWQ
jgi:phosphoglycolate phosphatase